MYDPFYTWFVKINERGITKIKSLRLNMAAGDKWVHLRIEENRNFFCLKETVCRKD